MSEVKLSDEQLERLAVRLAALLVEKLEASDPVAGRAGRVDLVDATEFARLLGTSRSYVYRHADELGAIRPAGRGHGRPVRFDPSSLDRDGEQPSSARVDAPAPDRRRGGQRTLRRGTPLLPIGGAGR